MIPRILVAGLRGGGGKTLVSTGLVAAWRRHGQTVVPFKKGPDYIDAAWLSHAAGVPCRNLDLFLMDRERIRESFRQAARGADLAVIEGNRGLFDGVDSSGSYSSAELAKLLRTPVVLVVDCTKVTRTAAAPVLGCQHLDPDLDLRGVILTRVAGPRHRSVLRRSIEEACGLPVLGSLPKFRGSLFPERHLGLVPPQEHHTVSDALREAGGRIEEHLDLDALEAVARSAPPLEDDAPSSVVAIRPSGRFPVWTDDADASGDGPGGGEGSVRLGVFRDGAFQFYYRDNLEALVEEGARLVEVSPLEDERLPDVDAVYIGGGFPETFAAALAANAPFRKSLRTAVDDGLPVYAECGGAVYLGEQLQTDETVYPMSGALPAVFGFGPRPAGHGYTELETVAENPFYEVGTELRGHEFHYTYLKSIIPRDVDFAFRVRRGHGFDGQRDGLCYRNTLACYTHVHALGVEGWAPALVEAARRHRGAAVGRRARSRASGGSP